MASMPQLKETIANWTKKQCPTIMVYKKHISLSKTNTDLRVKGWKKIFQANGPPKQAGVAI
jgi:hypothetical protein